MTKGNGKINGFLESNTIDTIEVGEPQDAKVVAINIVQFMQEVAQALEFISRHQAFHCKQIASLQAEVDALKAGLSAKPEPVPFGEINV